MNVNQGEAWFFVTFVIVLGIYCRKAENQKRVCIVKIFAVHDPRLRHNNLMPVRHVRVCPRRIIYPHYLCSGQAKTKIRSTSIQLFRQDPN